MEIEKAIEETVRLAYDSIRRIDDINRRLVIALIVMSVCFTVAICFDKWLDYKCVYVPEVEQTSETKDVKTQQSIGGN